MAPWDGWSDVAEAGMMWGMIGSVLMLGLIVLGVVLVVRAVARGREEGRRPCRRCGAFVRRGNASCTSCGTAMDWS